MLESISNLSAPTWHFEVFKISLSCMLNITTHNIEAVSLDFNPYTQIWGLAFWRVANNLSLMSTVCTVSIVWCFQTLQTANDVTRPQIRKKKLSLMFHSVDFFSSWPSKHLKGITTSIAHSQLWRSDCPLPPAALIQCLEEYWSPAFALLYISFLSYHGHTIITMQCSAIVRVR